MTEYHETGSIEVKCGRPKKQIGIHMIPKQNPITANPFIYIK